LVRSLPLVKAASILWMVAEERVALVAGVT
jgi:hypothetical protein